MKRHTRSLIELIESVVPHPIIGAEIGTWDGENAEQLLLHFDDLYLFMVDRYEALNDQERHDDPRMGSKTASDMLAAMESAWHRTRFAARRRVIVRGHSAWSSAFVEDKMLDFVFIDAHHAYSSVSRDISAWRNRLRSGGVLSGHDYDGRGDRIGRFGVKRAVDEFAAEHRYTVNIEPGNVWWIVV